MMRQDKRSWRSEFQQRFEAGLKKCCIAPGQPYLVGVSGGIDSVVLVNLLKQAGVDFIIAHLNHQLRETAARDQSFVQALAGQMGVGFVADTVDVGSHAEKEKLSLEEAARILRYQFLLDAAERNACAGVIVGHHADDQVETVLMHLLRGSGLAGLSGMAAREVHAGWSQQIAILRPMMGLWRSEIEQYCREEGLTFVEDESNADQRFYRNRLRHSLIPLLEEYNAGVKSHLWQTAAIVEEAENTLVAYAAEVWGRLIHTEAEGLIVCDWNGFCALETGLQRMLLRRMVTAVTPELRNYDYSLTLKTQGNILHPPEGGQWQIVDELYGLVHGEELLFGKIGAIKEFERSRYPQWGGEPYAFSGEKREIIALENGYSLTCEPAAREEISGEPWKTAGKDESWIDADACHLPLVMRSFEEGDAFTPFGMRGKGCKVSDYFIDHKIQQHARKNYPLICDQEAIVWLMGERISEPYQITDATKRVIRFLINRPEA